MKSWALKNNVFHSLNEQRSFQICLPKCMFTSFIRKGILLFYSSAKQNCFQPKNPQNSGLRQSW